ncbi:MAG: hypothetical protein HOM14_17240 [Gammaproteobacteria bacterium]|jgi:uncharacterized membrane-anchored protein YhcB (DUF1043 family)|nr:hypothetical protein [Gammaproteobacteria bacterium]MBT3723127.1 hypothetical protein [Gammaproteobacteria bacterium]MBT4077221.1 hypothetical protein [Gammaproteobacteria bacterium]MBT4192722.1 hypothetical protein [Gammaproteobacteria bacterium]MBT4451731.1 hypothetical protein [Gammaproteobacteria bacterium]
MTNNFHAFRRISWFWLLAVLILSGCGNRFEEQLRDTHKLVQSNVDNLKTQLDNKQLTNALLITKYAEKIKQIKPDYADVANLMAKEATSKSEAFLSLNKRLANVNLSPTSSESANFNLQELQLINSGADVYEFNNGLADVVNTLASLSGNVLPAVDVPAYQQESAQKSNALVGNPSYGNWKQDSSGRSFWEWYGMYSLFSNVLGGRSYYDSWSSRPNYSYYGNYGRNRWGSSTDVNRNYNLSQRHPSKYNKPSAATKSRYATTANRSSSYGGSTSKSTKSTKSGSRSSSYGSSSRSSSYSSSRSSRSGK